jgi:hypothetical protein
LHKPGFNLAQVALYKLYRAADVDTVASLTFLAEHLPVFAHIVQKISLGEKRESGVAASGLLRRLQMQPFSKLETSLPTRRFYL